MRTKWKNGKGKKVNEEKFLKLKRKGCEKKKVKFKVKGKTD